MQEKQYDQAYHPILAAGFAARGHSHEEIAAKLEIPWKTFQRWLNEEYKFRKAVKEGQSFVIAQVEIALVRSATGFEYTETTTGPNSKNPDFIETKVTTKFIPPNVKAQIFFLQNKAPEYWTDRSKLDGLGSAPVTWKEVRQDIKPEHLKDIATPAKAAKICEKWQQN